jgi:hypothetical protein
MPDLPRSGKPATTAVLFSPSMETPNPATRQPVPSGLPDHFSDPPSGGERCRVNCDTENRRPGADATRGVTMDTTGVGKRIVNGELPVVVSPGVLPTKHIVTAVDGATSLFLGQPWVQPGSRCAVTPIGAKRS